MNGAGLLEESTLTTPDDGPLADPGAVYHGALPTLRGAIDELHRFQSS